jgi:flagellar protein FliO/FliZ
MIPFTLKRGAACVCALTLLYALAVVCVAPAWAVESSFANRYGASKPVSVTSGTHTHASTASFSGTIVRTIVGLAIVIAVIYGISWLLRQSRSARNSPMGDGLAQIASLPLGTNRSVALVRVGDELHLIGVADHSVTSIRVFTEEQAYELGLPFDPEDTYTSGGNGAMRQMQRLIESLRRSTVR